MEQKKPLVSIIVRTKDRPKLLRNAIKSIAEQTYRPIEVVLVNDGGCYLNVEELKNILGDMPLNYIRLEKNTGRAHAGNIGIENARGDYIGFLDDDDEYYPEHVITLVDYLQQSDVKIAYTDSLMVYQEYNSQTQAISTFKKEIIYSQDFNYNNLVFENYIPFMCLLFNREALISANGFFDGIFDLYEDWDLLIRVGEKHPFHHIKKITANYNQWSSESQISQKNKDYHFLKLSYLKVLSKHNNKFTEERIHSYISKCVKTRDTLRANIRNIEKVLREKDAHIIGNLEAILWGKDAHIENIEKVLREKDAHIENIEKVLREKDAQLGEKNAILDNIYGSHGWKTLLFYYKIRSKLFPPNTQRTLFVKLFFNALLNPKLVFKKFTKANFRKFILYLKTSEPTILEAKIKTKFFNESNTTDKDRENMVTHDININSALQLYAILRLRLFLSDVENKLKFNVFKKPIVSIIIITFNKAWHTYRCLESLKAHVDLPHEIIIVDNSSADDTQELLNRIEGIKIIKNQYNYGFVKACNQGSRIASGEYLLFLNNDTEILPNLISNLIATIEKVERCQAVGARLILPNGKLQEAGDIIWNDGSALGYGRFDNPFKPEYSYLREVDYCSAACLLVKSDLFRELGGFDERYAPAYYEESDFCMKIREKGYKVLYQPFAIVIHYEFGSSSLSKAVELQESNREKFIKKWEAVLKKHFPYQSKNILLARDKQRSSRVLVVDDRIPALHLGSGFPRMYNMLSLLVELGYKVTFFPLQNPQPMEPYTRNLQQRGIEIFYNNGTSKLDIADFLNKRANYYDIALVSRPHNAKEIISLVKNKLTNIKTIIYDAEALFSHREITRCKLNGLDLTKKEQDKMIRDEVALMKHADVVMAVSKKEKDTINKAGIQNVMVWGHPISTNATKNSFSEREGILFVGSFLHQLTPNEDAILYFTSEIFPIIQKKMNVKLFIVGINLLDSIKKLASSSIIVTGQVDDLKEYYNKCKIFIVPTRYAAGVPWKLQEAMSYGLPSVVTPIIADQLELTNLKEVVIGATPLEFADHVTSLYQDEELWNSLRDEGLRCIEKTCNLKKLKQDLEDIFSFVKKTKI